MSTTNMHFRKQSEKVLFCFAFQNERVAPALAVTVDLTEPTAVSE
jgi:hypothetical protein